MSLSDVILKAREVFSPWSFRSGTEHMAVLLYSLLRSTRPRTVIEYGSGYTTSFLAQALRENREDFRTEKRLLLAKSEPLVDFVPPPGAIETWPQADRANVMRWLGSGGPSANVDPAFYLEDHAPRLFSFEEQTADSEYAQKMVRLLADLQLTDLVTIENGATFSIESWPADVPIDFAWNDYDRYREFFEQVWPKLNPNGGICVFHYTSDRQHSSDVAWMKERQRAAGDLEVLTIFESHKLVQNGCTILRRTTKSPAFVELEPSRVIVDLGRLARQSAPAPKGGTQAAAFPIIVGYEGFDRAQLRALVRERGCVVLRGGTQIDAGAFESLADELCSGDLIRRSFYAERMGPPVGAVFGVDEGNHALPLHAENSFFPPARPDVGFLWMKLPSAVAGKTTVADGCEVFRNLHATTRDRLRDARFRWHLRAPYTVFAPFYGVSDAAAFTSTLLPRLVEDCASRHVTLVHSAQTPELAELVFETSLVMTTHRGPAVASSFAYLGAAPPTGTHPGIWLYPTDPALATLVPELRAINEHAVLRPDWQPDDIVVFDNWSVLHGRDAFAAGSARDIRTCWGHASWIRP